MAEETVFYRIQIDGADDVSNALTKLTLESKELADQKKALNKQLDDLNKAYRENTITQKEYDEQSKQLAQDISQTNLQIKQNSAELSANQKTLLDSSKATQVAEGSIEQMRLELAKAQKEYVKLSAEERNNANIGGKLQQQIKAQSDELKDLEKNVGITSRSVGDYGQAVQGVLPMMGSFGSQIQSIISNISGLKDAFSKLSIGTNSARTTVQGFASAQKNSNDATEGGVNAIKNNTSATIGFGASKATATKETELNTASTISNKTATDSATRSTIGFKVASEASAGAQKAMATGSSVASKALKVLRVALISTGIGAIVVALGSLVAYFASTQEGSDKVTRALRPLQAVFSSLFGIIQDVGGTAFQILTGYFQTFTNNFVLGAKLFQSGVLKMRIAWNNFTGDDLEAKALTEELDNVNKEIDEARKNILDGQKQMQDGFAKMGDIAKGAGDRIGEAFNNGKREADLEIEIEKLEAIENLTLGRLQRQRLAQKEISEDASKSQAEREIATKKELEFLEEELAFQDNLNKKKLELLSVQQTYNDTNREGNKEYNDLLAEQEQREAEATEKRIEASKRLYAIRKAQEDKAKKEAEDREKARLQAEQDAIKKQIELAQIGREMQSAIEEETAEERYLREVELQKKIFDLKIESAKKAGEDTVILEKQKALALAKLAREESDRQNELKKEQAEKDAEAEAKKKEKEEADAKVLFDTEEADRKALNNQILASAQELSGTLIDTFRNRTEREKQIELDSLNARLEAGTISQEQFEKAREKIERKAFEQKKKQDTASALINGAVAVTKALAQSGLAGLLLAGTIAVQTGAQIATIQKQKFSRGGVAKGKSHANGGIPFTVAGQGGYEMEGGEAIINKRSTAMFRDQLSAINQAGGGVAFSKGGLATPNYSAVKRYQDGGIANISSEIGKFGSIKEDIVNGVLTSIQAIKVVNVATETTNRSSRVKQIENQNSF